MGIPRAEFLKAIAALSVFSSSPSSKIKLDIFPPPKKNIKVRLQPTNKACKYSKINPKKSSNNIVFLGYIGKCSYLKKNFALYDAKDYWVSSLVFLLNELNIKFSVLNSSAKHSVKVIIAPLLELYADRPLNF